MKIKFIKEYRALSGESLWNCAAHSVGAVLDVIPVQAQWLIDNGFADEVKENYLFEDITHDDQGDKVAVDIWFSKDKDGGHPKKMVDFIQFMEAINVVSQDEGFMTRSANGSSWVICLKDDGQLDATVTTNELAGAFCFEWNDDAKASIKKHTGEWRTILNYDWSKE